MARTKASPQPKSKTAAGKGKRDTSFRVFTLGKKKYKLNNKVLKQIKKMQLTTEYCIPKSPFSRLVREVCKNVGREREDLRIQTLALEALQEAAEMYMVNLFEDANICAAHAKRITVRPDDMKLSLTLRGCSDPGCE